MRLSFFSYLPEPLNFFCDLAGDNLSSFIHCIVWHFWLICRVSFTFFMFWYLYLIAFPCYMCAKYFFLNLSLVILLSCHLFHCIGVAWSPDDFITHHSVLPCAYTCHILGCCWNENSLCWWSLKRLEYRFPLLSESRALLWKLV